MIRKQNGKYVLYSKDGSKRLGSYTTREAALKRERQVNAFKNMKNKKAPSKNKKNSVSSGKGGRYAFTPNKVKKTLRRSNKRSSSRA